ncbi:MAG: hypothetical protein QM803_04955 [Rhodocyclaceae bacterium]
MADEAGLAGRLVVLLSQPVHWQIRLCVFKYIAYCSTSHEARSALWHIARDDICASNIFVRAWAYNMLAWTAEGLPSHAEEARELLAMGARDEPPAVRARIRAALRRRYVP